MVSPLPSGAGKLATARPWAFRELLRGKSIAIDGGNWKELATVYATGSFPDNKDGIENARLIVEAVNSHDALVKERDQLKAALEDLLAVVEGANGDRKGAKEQARAALAQGKGGK